MYKYIMISERNTNYDGIHSIMDLVMLVVLLFRVKNLYEIRIR